MIKFTHFGSFYKKATAPMWENWPHESQKPKNTLYCNNLIYADFFLFFILMLVEKFMVQLSVTFILRKLCYHSCSWALESRWRVMEKWPKEVDVDMWGKKLFCFCTISTLMHFFAAYPSYNLQVHCLHRSYLASAQLSSGYWADIKRRIDVTDAMLDAMLNAMLELCVNP